MVNQNKEMENINRKEEKIELLKPKNDIVFQSLFNQKNENITRNMISALLEENITSIKINEDKELLREYPEDKLGILDLEAETNEKAQWMLFINNPNDEEVQEVVKENKEIKEARVEVKKMSEDEKLKRLAYLREKAILDEKDIYEAGREKATIEMVKKLKEKNIPIDTIAEITDLSKEEIEKI